MKFQYRAKTIEFEVHRRDRKTLEIRIEPPDQICVAAPKYAKDEEILRAVQSKRKWIIEKLSELESIGSSKKEKEYVDGESFLYLGRNYSLKIIENPKVKSPVVKLYRGKFCIETNTKDPDKLRQAMEHWYRQKTLKKVLEQVKYFQDYFSVKPRSVKVKEQKKRWGSCNSKGDLMFNWRISMAPLSVIRYIVLHEICHIVHFNHSRDFWTLLERIMPHYMEKKEWLGRYGVMLDL